MSKSGDHVVSIDQNDCWDLLSSHRVGRVAVTIRGHPMIFPVNYVVDDSMADRSIVFRTADGNKLDGLLHGPSTVFEIDEFDGENRRGWSVVAAGTSNVMTSGSAQRGALDAKTWRELDTWAFDEMSFAVRLTPTSVSGRRVG
ncbi:MAG: pyridoxamine 5'-phosphate oxidase family protein [Acidobacteria bacterium]|nr:pyridoxamine 5'-phosphate oxidase family protein [Acidobacteriota bacterium]